MATQEAAATEDQETPPDPEVVGGGTDVEIPPDKPPEPAAAQKTRSERRTERGQGYAQEAADARRRADESDRRAQRVEVELAELRGRVTATQASQPDPAAKALDDIATKIENVVARLGAGDDSARAEWHALRREEARLVARMEAGTVSKEAEDRITKAMPQQLDPRQAALYAEFPDLQDDVHFKAIANGHVSRLVATKNRDMANPQVRFATLREGAALAMRDLGRGGDEHREPSTRDRERVSGTAGGDTGAGPGKTVVHLTAEQQKMAMSLYRRAGLTQDEANVKWWKDVGSKIK